MYMRIYGNELMYKQHHDIPLIDQFQKAVNPKAVLDAMAREKTVSEANLAERKSRHIFLLRRQHKSTTKF